MTTTPTTIDVAAIEKAAGPRVRDQWRPVQFLTIAASWPEPIALPDEVTTAASVVVAVAAKALPTPPPPPAPSVYLSDSGDDVLVAHVTGVLTRDRLAGARHGVIDRALAELASAVDAHADAIWSAIDESFARAFTDQLDADLIAGQNLTAADVVALTPANRRNVERSVIVHDVLHAAHRLAQHAAPTRPDASLVEHAAQLATFADFAQWRRFTDAQRPGPVLRGPLLAELAKAGAHPAIARSKRDVEQRIAALDASKLRHDHQPTPRQVREIESNKAMAKDIAAHATASV